MPSWSELVSIVLPVVFGLGMIFLKTTRQRPKVINGRSASEAKHVITIAE